MPETPIGLAAIVTTLVLAVIAVAQRVALARVQQVTVNTDKSAVENERDRAAIAQSTLLNEIAATALKTQEREGNYRVALAELKGSFDVQAVRLDFLEKNNVRLETANLALTQANARLEKRLDDRDAEHRRELGGTNTQITDLNAEIARLKTLVDGLPALTEALRNEVSINKDASATPEQVSAAEQASADATAATLAPVHTPLTDAGTTKIEGVVTLSPTDKPAETKDKPK